MHKYRLVAKKGEGTFSEVLKAQAIKNGKYVAIKCMKNHFESLDQVNNLREIQALRRLSPHPHVIKLLEVLYDQPTGRLALVFELMDMNIYELIRGRRHYVSEERVKFYMYQLMKSMDHMHRNGIFHRDIKPENILIADDCLKLADFGSCRGIYSKQPYTEYISTRWYRAPECLLTDGYYNYKMDMWGVGCVFFEIVSLFPLFPGTNELDQINKIHNILGTPPAELLAKFKRHSHMDFNFPAKEGSGIGKLIPHASAECVELINKLLAYNPDDRLSARQALRHPYFRELREAEKRQRAAMTPDINGSLLLAEAERNKLFANQDGNDSDGSHGSHGSRSSRNNDPTKRKHRDKQRILSASSSGGASTSTLPVIPTRRNSPGDSIASAPAAKAPDESPHLPNLVGKAPEHRGDSMVFSGHPGMLSNHASGESTTGSLAMSLAGSMSGTQALPQIPLMGLTKQQQAQATRQQPPPAKPVGVGAGATFNVAHKFVPVQPAIHAASYPNYSKAPVFSMGTTDATPPSVVGQGFNSKYTALTKGLASVGSGQVKYNPNKGGSTAASVSSVGSARVNYDAKSPYERS